MKITITLAIEVDPVSWSQTYGNDNVRQSVEDYVLYSVKGLPGIEESGATVTAKRPPSPMQRRGGHQ